MLPRTHRLTKARDFQEVFKQGKSFRWGGVVLKARSSKNSTSRFAIVVSKKVAAKAVKRNKIRRLFGEAIQAEIKHIPSGLDLVLVILPGFKIQSLQEIKNIFKQLLLKILN